MYSLIIQKEQHTATIKEEQENDLSLSLDSIELVWEEDIQDRENELEKENHTVAYAV